MSSWPDRLQVNAFAGEGVPNSSALDASARRWAARAQEAEAEQWLWAEKPPDEADWRHPDVGWGLVLPDAPELSAEQLAAAEDAPDPIRALLEARPDAPVLRYRAKTATSHLRRYSPTVQDVKLSGSRRGVGQDRLPLYLLIYGTPEQIPWRFQFLLNQSAAVGRLALTGAALERYVSHLIDDWQAAASDPHAAVVWAVDHGGKDISHLMRNVIAEPLFQEFADDDDLRERSLRLAGTDEDTTAQALIDALSERRPALVITTSHGMTGPLEDVEAMRANLGVPVDSGYRGLDVRRLLESWEPDGAIWYAHACCSAGGDHQTAFKGVVPEGSDVERILVGAAKAGACIAPLPDALLSANKPARAFIGHVEPTFDWTLSDPDTGQPLTEATRFAFFDGLYQPWPLGHALRKFYAHVGELFGARTRAYEEHYQEGKDTLATALAHQLAALDRRSMVILGDPTVALSLS
jgi:hypothetical protein